jgi:hypothetical protein
VIFLDEVLFSWMRPRIAFSQRYGRKSDASTPAQSGRLRETR